MGPRDSGRLDAGDGHRVYWEEWGSPAGKPAVVLHGGPGSGCDSWWTTRFDLDAYRVVLVDQRGCGRSLPHAGHDLAALQANTTHHLIADLERLRETLRIERWLVLGASWGSTLGLAYAQAHPESVSEIVLWSVVTTTRREVEWVTRHVGRYFPGEWERLRDGVPPRDREGNLALAYSRLLTGSDAEACERAAVHWCRWEDFHMRTHPDDPPDERFEDPVFRLCFARLVTHYWANAAWLEEGSLIAGAGALGGIPAVLVHGRLDLSAPVDVPWRLARAWPGAELIVVDTEGHRGGQAMKSAVIDALRRFAGRG